MIIVTPEARPRLHRGPEYRRLKEIVLKRDRFLCQFPGCGKRHKKGRRRRLEIHHIIPWSWGEVDELWNLVALCQAHHKMVDALLGAHQGDRRGRALTH